jgi:hypothetical protein
MAFKTKRGDSKSIDGPGTLLNQNANRRAGARQPAWAAGTGHDGHASSVALGSGSRGYCKWQPQVNNGKYRPKVGQAAPV